MYTCGSSLTSTSVLNCGKPLPAWAPMLVPPAMVIMSLMKVSEPAVMSGLE